GRWGRNRWGNWRWLLGWLGLWFVGRRLWFPPLRRRLPRWILLGKFRAGRRTPGRQQRETATKDQKKGDSDCGREEGGPGTPPRPVADNRGPAGRGGQPHRRSDRQGGLRLVRDGRRVRGRISHGTDDGCGLARRRRGRDDLAAQPLPQRRRKGGSVGV